MKNYNKHVFINKQQLKCNASNRNMQTFVSTKSVQMIKSLTFAKEYLN